MKKINQHGLSLYSSRWNGVVTHCAIGVLLLVTSASAVAAPVTNGVGTKATVTATALKYDTAPAGSVSGIALTTQPVVKAEDAFGNVDTDYTNTVTLTEASAGALTDATQAATAGVATFTGLLYTASTDNEAFVLTASEGSLSDAVASSITSDVLATKLVFTTQPAPTSLETNTVTAFTTVPVVTAQDANNTVDTDFTEVITVVENGAGIGTFTNATATASSGVATFTGLTLSHDTAETLQLVADDDSSVGTNLGSVQSNDLIIAANTAPTITGTSANQAVNDNATLSPFSGVTLADSEGNDLSVTITLDDTEKGTLSTASIASGTIASVQTALQAITFTPTANRGAVGSTETTTFTLAVSDSVNTTTNTVTTAVSTSINDSPTAIGLSNSSVAKGTSTIGALSTTDADPSESFTYTLVSGTGDDDNASFSISSSTLEIATTLNAGSYSVRVQTEDGHSGTFVEAFTITITDTAAPRLASLTPADEATNVATDTNLTFTLSEEVVKGTGDILIIASANDSVIETIDVTGSQVSISGTLITIDPNTILSISAEYYIHIPNTAFKDSADNFFAGISDSTTWSFTTSATKIVPTNQPTNFVATSAASSITTTWTDAVSGSIPDSYLVLCSTSNSFTAPVNGVAQTTDTDCSDGTGVQNITAGTQTASWTGLTQGTEYFFTVYPYTNTGTDILYKTDGTLLTDSATPSVDADATLTAADGITEPVDLPSINDTVAEAVDLFDFKLTDGGTSDGVSTDVTQIVVRTSGTGDFSKVVWRLNGNDATNVTGVYDANANTITFSSLSLSIADGSNETYTINAYFDSTSGITDNSTFLLSVDGANGDVTVDANKTQMQPDVE